MIRASASLRGLRLAHKAKYFRYARRLDAFDRHVIVVIDVQPFCFQLGTDLSGVPLSHRAVIQHLTTFIDDALQEGQRVTIIEHARP